MCVSTHFGFIVEVHDVVVPARFLAVAGGFPPPQTLKKQEERV